MSQNIFGNELKIYNPNNGTGSTLEEVIAVYGEPMYEYSYTDDDRTICYKYKIQDYGENQNVYLTFSNSLSKCEGKLSSVMISDIKYEIENGYIVP